MGSCRPEPEQIMKNRRGAEQIDFDWNDWILFERANQFHHVSFYSSSSWSVSHLRPQSLLMDWQRWAWIWRLGGRQYCDFGSWFLLIELIQYFFFFMFRIVVRTTGCHSLIVFNSLFMFVCCCPKMKHLNVKQMSLKHINMCFNLISCLYRQVPVLHIFQRGQDDLIPQDVIHQLMSSIDMDCVPRWPIIEIIDLSKRDFHIRSLHFVHGSSSSIDTIHTLKE